MSQSTVNNQPIDPRAAHLQQLIAREESRRRAAAARRRRLEQARAEARRQARERRIAAMCRPIYDTETGERWESIQAASEALGVPRSTIRIAIRANVPVLAHGRRCRYLAYTPADSPSSLRRCVAPSLTSGGPQ